MGDNRLSNPILAADSVLCSRTTGKPVLDIRFKVEYGYVIIRRYRENMAERDVEVVEKTLEGMKNLLRELDMDMFDAEEMETAFHKATEENRSILEDGKPHDVKIALTDMVTGKTDKMTVAITIGMKRDDPRVKAILARKEARDKAIRPPAGVV